MSSLNLNACAVTGVCHKLQQAATLQVKLHQQVMLEGKTCTIAGDLFHSECCLTCSMSIALRQGYAS
jgi:hypothetical protein